MAATLSTNQIIKDVLDAFKVRFPLLKNIATDFKAEAARLGDQVIARVSTVPSVQDYDGSSGYEANAANANDLLVDVPVTINRHKHVPVKIDYIDQISTQRNLYEEALGNLAYALGKEAFDYAMSLILATNFSQSSTFTTGNSDKDMLDNISGDLNGVGAAPIGRFGIVNSAVYATLEGDSKIASGDYHGQLKGGHAYGHLRNVAGFEDIYEYPSFPDNSENLTGYFGTRAGIVMSSRLPVDVKKLAARLGIPQIAKTEIVTDEETGLSLLGISWQKSGTFDLYTTMVWLYGISAGKQGGSSGTITDYAGHRLVTS